MEGGLEASERIPGKATLGEEGGTHTPAGGTDTAAAGQGKYERQRRRSRAQGQHCDEEDTGAAAPRLGGPSRAADGERRNVHGDVVQHAGSIRVRRRLGGLNSASRSLPRGGNSVGNTGREG
jgi:hypothetical protein